MYMIYCVCVNNFDVKEKYLTNFKMQYNNLMTSIKFNFFQKKNKLFLYLLWSGWSNDFKRSYNIIFCLTVIF
uniref:Uncharacterized protein n=1 Tax=Octopus bimaculoides TaxID=37653 RepID=A0A0L8G4U1_OCTBM